MGDMHSNNASISTNLLHHSTENSVATNSWIDGVMKKKGFKTEDIIEKGMVRTKFRVRLPRSSNEIAVTVWKNDYIEDKLSPWKKFHNENVTSLLYSETLTDLNAELYYTILPYCNLQKKVNSEEFRARDNAMCKIVDYLITVTQGLNYIQAQGYNHLNVKPSSFAIFKDENVKVDQLHFLNPINSSTKRNGLLQCLCPPETYYDPEMSNKYSSKFDSWSLGIMMIELFTGSYLTKKLPKFVESWCLEVYPVIFKILKKKKFEKVVRKRFPKESSGINLKDLRYLVANILTLHPKDRPKIQEIHERLGNLLMKKNSKRNTGFYAGKSKIWKRKLHWGQLMIEIARVSSEAKEELEKTQEKDDKSSLKIFDDTERMESGKRILEEENSAEDLYKSLRREIEIYYGVKYTQDSPLKDKIKPTHPIFTPSASQILSKPKKETVFSKISTLRDDDEIKVTEISPLSEISSQKEVTRGKVLENEMENSQNKISWSGSMFTKFKNFADSSIKYVTNPWFQANPTNYLHQLSTKLTG